MSSIVVDIVTASVDILSGDKARVRGASVVSSRCNSSGGAGIGTPVFLFFTFSWFANS